MLIPCNCRFTPHLTYLELSPKYRHLKNNSKCSRWSSTGIIASVLLIELDRFLAIRYPLKYPVFMTDERSLVACIGTQFGTLVLCIVVRLASPETFSCSAIFVGDMVRICKFLRHLKPSQFSHSHFY